MKHLQAFLLSVLILGSCAENTQERPLAAPGGLEVTDTTETLVTVRWTAVDGAEKYRWAIESSGFVDRGFTNRCTLTIDGLDPGENYRLSVRAEAGERYSEWSEVEFSTVAAPVIPDPPVDPDPPAAHTVPAVFIGDSITELWPQTDAAFFTSHGYVGKGVSGQTSRTIAARFKNDVVKKDPYVVHIMCGINDVAENDGAYVESSAILANIEKMADMAEEAGIKVVVGSLTPANKFWWWADDWKPSREGVTIVSHIQEANALIKAWCEERSYPFIDYYTRFVADDGSFPGPYAYDGVHPALEGFLEMDKLVQPVLEELLKDVQL
ncbi:MAG: hypothetical protein J6X77_04905 [Bacteroidales bacterium]|nr:hypothetical protein [Bacteroidales bacterium]